MGNTISSIDYKEAVKKIYPKACIQWGYVDVDIAGVMRGTGDGRSFSFLFGNRNDPSFPERLRKTAWQNIEYEFEESLSQ